MENEDSISETKSSHSREIQRESSQENTEVIDPNPKGTSKFLLSALNIHPLLFCVFLSDGLSASVIVNLVMDRSCRMHFNSSICKALDDSKKNSTDLEKLVQPYASLIITEMSLLSTIVPVFMSLFLGAWSDQNGRKLLLVLPAIGYSFKYLLLSVFSQIPNVHPALFLLSEVPVAISGGITNFITATFAYICDISKKNECSVRMGILEAVMLSGNIIGYLSSAPLYNTLGTHRYLIIFGISFSVTFFSAVLTHFLVAESVRSVENGKGIWHIFDVTLLKEMLSVCLKKRKNFRRAMMFLVILSMSFALSAMSGESNVKFLFMRLKFHWSIEQYTEWIAVNDGTVFLGFIIGTLLLNKIIRISDVFLGIMSFVMIFAHDLYIALVPSDHPNFMYYSGLVKMFSGFFSPAGRSLISKCVPKEELGKVFALTTSCECILPLAVGPLYTLLYNYTLNKMPETIFFVSSGIYIVNILFFIIVYVIERRYRENTYESIESDEVTE